MRDRLIELLKKMQDEPYITCPEAHTDKLCKECRYNMNDDKCNHIERQADYLLANGVIVPPCKVGDTVFYFDDYYRRIKELQFTGIESVLECKSLEGKRRAFLISALGKSLFLTREAAEQDLKGR